MPWFFKHRQDPDQRVFPAYEFQSSKNRCRRPSGGSLQTQKKVAPPCRIETPITSNQPFNGNSGVRSESGCRREHKPSGTGVSLTKQQRCTPSSPEDLLWASDHEDLKRSIPKPPQVTRTPSPTKVRRWDKYSANVLGAAGFVRSPGKNHGCLTPWFRRSHDLDLSRSNAASRVW